MLPCGLMTCVMRPLVSDDQNVVPVTSVICVRSPRVYVYVTVGALKLASGFFVSSRFAWS